MKEFEIIGNTLYLALFTDVTNSKYVSFSVCILNLLFFLFGSWESN
jgi:hypothetical protein